MSEQLDEVMPYFIHIIEAPEDCQCEFCKSLEEPEAKEQK